MLDVKTASSSLQLCKWWSVRQIELQLSLCILLYLHLGSFLLEARKWVGFGGFCCLSICPGV